MMTVMMKKYSDDIDVDDDDDDNVVVGTSRMTPRGSNGGRSRVT